MAKRILILDGHPDPAPERFVHALARAYADGSRSAGHEICSIVLGQMEFPLLRSNAEFRGGHPPQVIREGQEAIQWADHLVILFPLWLGSMPALLKGYLEQTLRPGFAFAEAGQQGLPVRLLAGRSARIVVTMGMPALFYRWYFRAHSLRSLERNILKFCGFNPVRSILVGMVDALDAPGRERWLAKCNQLGVRGQ
ncbi:MAG TPA: NAD(P)H-dependent oxidoreductase [Steroidobacteraceae bacterium]|nr:NAD(P)H-dependent oxidoreductase [Steroidobacteraceae bacterium]